MINFQEEIKRFKPSLDVDNIEDVITGIDLTDMGDLMMQLAQNASDAKAAKQDSRRAERRETDGLNDEI
ncbi:MAG: hypothetical protein IJU30_05375 [Lachnospiraceae bacterium]|nr:hypothetical protein [Lachnospiraceae bacterium]